MNQHHHSPKQAWSLLLVSLLFAVCALPAKATRLVILHTNDVHDHVRPGYDGAGGLPYVSGYIRQVRAVEPAVRWSGRRTGCGRAAARRRFGSWILPCWQHHPQPPAFGTRGRDALFVAGGQRGDKTVLVALTGAQIKAYVTLLGGGEKYNQTTWSGMRVMHGADGTKDPLTTSLDDNRKYSVIMPELEWSSRFVKMSDLARKKTPGSPLAGPLPEPRPSSVEMTLALRTRALELTQSARSLGAEARAFADAGTDVPDDPLWWR